MRRKERIVSFLLILTFLVPFSIGDAFAAVSSSTNYRIDGGQIVPIYGTGSSTDFSIEIGGNSISGKSTSTNFQAQQGAPLGPGTPAATSAASGDSSGNAGGFPTPKAFGIEVRNITPAQVEITFETNTGGAIGRIDYGALGNYNLTAGEAESGRFHRFILSNLLPGTLYNYRIHLEVSPENVNDMGPYTFTTLPIITAVPNVSEFRALPSDTDISLGWINPAYGDYRRTVIVKSSARFPRNSSDGEVIFRGAGESYTDSDVEKGNFYYYGAFVESIDGEFSSGVIVSARVGVLKAPAREKEKEVIVPAKPPPLPPEITPTPETGIREVLINIFTLLKQQVIEGFYRLSQAFDKLSQESKKQAGAIREGLVDQYGRLQQDILEALTPSEREEFEEIIGEELPKEFSRDTVNVVTAVNLLSDKEVDWRVFADSDVLLTIPRSIFLKDVDVITVAISTQAYALSYNSESDAYEALIKAPQVKGKYQAVVQIIYRDNTFEEVNRVVLVDPYGIAYFKKQRPWSWTKPWQILMADKIPVEGAKVTLETLSRTKEWVLWPAHLYNQFNPIVTGENGAFAFVVPSGTYRLSVEAKGFSTFNGSSFEVDEQVINIDIKLHKQLSTAKIILLLLVGIMVVALVLVLKNRARYVKG